MGNPEVIHREVIVTDESRKNAKSKLNFIREKIQPLHTDAISININADGVIIDIREKVGDSKSLQIITKVGMSREYARKFGKKLTEIISLTTKHTHHGKKVN